MFGSLAGSLLGWCELRRDYRNFRFDRFTPTAEISIASYQKQVIGIRDSG